MMCLSLLQGSDIVATLMRAFILPETFAVLCSLAFLDELTTTLQLKCWSIGNARIDAWKHYLS